MAIVNFFYKAGKEERAMFLVHLVCTERNASNPADVEMEEHVILLQESVHVYQVIWETTVRKSVRYLSLMCYL